MSASQSPDVKPGRSAAKFAVAILVVLIAAAVPVFLTLGGESEAKPKDEQTEKVTEGKRVDDTTGHTSPGGHTTPPATTPPPPPPPTATAMANPDRVCGGDPTLPLPQEAEFDDGSPGEFYDTSNPADGQVDVGVAEEDGETVLYVDLDQDGQADEAGLCQGGTYVRIG